MKGETIDVIGKTFGYMTALSVFRKTHPRIATRTEKWVKCRCVCGTEKDVWFYNLTKNVIKSCGCKSISLRPQNNSKRTGDMHSMRQTLESIKTRCRNKKSANYKNYGGRGIRLSDDFNDFETWYAYVSTLPLYEKRKELGLTLDRINNDLGYEVGNLRWATAKEQRNNMRPIIYKKRPYKPRQISIEVQSKILSIFGTDSWVGYQDTAKKLGIGKTVVWNVVKNSQQL